MGIAELQGELRAFGAARGWGAFHTPKNLVLALVGEVGELAEVFQWLTAEESAAVMSEPRTAEAVRHELADVFSYLLQLADVLGVDLEHALTEKIRVNAGKYPVSG